MGNILLDYFFPIQQIDPVPGASTAFLRQICLVVKPANGVTTGVITECETMIEVAGLTNNVEAQELFDAGLSRVYILPSDDLDVASALAAGGSKFYTLAVSSDFEDSDLSSLDLGGWDGVVGFSSDDDAVLEAQAVIKNRVGFLDEGDVQGAKDMLWAFAQILKSLTNWRNQQYIPMQEDAAAVTELSRANNLFEKRISFVIADAQYGKRLAFFAAGGQAIVAPYILRNLEIDMQSKGLQYVVNNQPQYTLTEATLIQDELQSVIDEYIERGWIEAGVVAVLLQQSNFVATGQIDVATPSALWKIAAELRQTL